MLFPVSRTVGNELFFLNFQPMVLGHGRPNRLGQVKTIAKVHAYQHRVHSVLTELAVQTGYMWWFK